MAKTLFGVAVVLHLIACSYYVYRFLHKRRPISLVLSALCVGWALAFARELRWVPLVKSGVIWAAGIAVAVLHLVAIYAVESQEGGRG
jgi:hypothetical protein